MNYKALLVVAIVVLFALATHERLKFIENHQGGLNYER